ncbi:MAG: NTP/NDP exchange transporter [Vicinamibacterales bacterium]
MTSFLQRFANVRREETAPVLMAGLFFMLILTALMVIRPAREALGMQRGIESVRWLFVGTAVVTLAVNPVFGWMVSRFRRMVFISATYVFFAASLVVFWALIELAPDAVGERSGQVFFVWFSVFNLFSTMVFWALMVDRFSLEQSKRLFGIIAVGGTIGAILGPWLATVLAEPLGTANLLLVSAVALLLAVGAAWGVVWLQGEPAAGAHRGPDAAIGGSAWEGFRAALGSPYLLGISGFVLIMTVLATFIYFTRLQMVAALGDDLDMRTSVFAQIDLITQTTTLLLQALVTGHIMRRFGVAFALALLPVTAALGFFGLALAGSFVVLVIFDATFRAVQRAIMRPARETLFTVVSTEDKYKSKAFTDTFVYRGGDLLGAWTEGALGQLGMGLYGLATAAGPLAVVWGGLGIWLGRRQPQMADPSSASDGPLADQAAASTV